MKPTNFTLSFTAQGHISQTIQITNPAYTPKRIVAMLNSGKAVTTVQENGTVDIVATGEVIGKVVNVNNELEYDDFELVK
jgi:hypothetical protein